MEGGREGVFPRGQGNHHHHSMEQVFSPSQGERLTRRRTRSQWEDTGQLTVATKEAILPSISPLFPLAARRSRLESGKLLSKLLSKRGEILVSITLKVKTLRKRNFSNVGWHRGWQGLEIQREERGLSRGLLSI